jgi:hypothetical protein
MQNEITFKESAVDFESINGSEITDNDVNLLIFSDTSDLLSYNSGKDAMEGTIFSIWLEIGEEKEKTIIFNISIDDLELFALSVLKHVKIIRKNYGDQIKIQNNMNCSV